VNVLNKIKVSIRSELNKQFVFFYRNSKIANCQQLLLYYRTCWAWTSYHQCKQSYLICVYKFGTFKAGKI